MQQTWLARAIVIGLVVAIGSTTAILLAHPDDPKEKDREPVYTGPGFKRAHAKAGEQPRVYSQQHSVEPAPSKRAGLGSSPLAGTTFDAVGLQLQSWLTIPELDTLFGSTSGNDIWGYTAPSGREYAIIGLSRCTAFVEITDPANATVVTVFSGPTSTWRDIKTYGTYSYSVSEGGGGIQVFDLSQIDNGVITSVVPIISPGTMSSHNVVVDAENGFLYRCGGGSNVGLRAYDLTNPAAPSWVGDWNDRYVHDAQVVTMAAGPWANKQIGFLCSGFNNGGTDTGLDIVDLTNKAAPVNLSRIKYAGGEYSHQAWLSEDQQYLFLNDELDEDGVLPTVTHILDVSDLANPRVAGRFASNSTSIGHNLFTSGDKLYAANYRSGLRVFDISDPLDTQEIAYFDTYPPNDNANYNGLWGTYLHFPSGTIIGSDIEKGLFVWSLEAVVAFPAGRPDRFDAVGTGIFVEFEEVNGAIDGSTAAIVYDYGAGPLTEPLVQQEGANYYEAVLPSMPCGAVVNWYVTALTTEGVLVQSPTTAPAKTHEAVVAWSTPSLLFDDAESDAGWTTEVAGATDGAWERGVPVNTDDWLYDVDTAAGGSGSAWLTENSTGNTDVDNGSVRLISPEFDLTYGEVVISYDYFLRMTVSDGGADGLFVEVTEDESSGVWTQVAVHVADTGFRWLRGTIDQQSIEDAGVVMTPTMKVRFSATDVATASVVEAGLDNIAIGQANCCPGDCTGGPVAGDGVIDVLDLLAVLAAWGDAGPDCDVAPEHGDGVINVVDLLAVLAGWGPCE